MVKATFITTRRTNIGDDFVREGLRAVLDDLCEYHAYLVHKHDFNASCATPYPEEEGPAVPDKVLNADLVFHSGAPVYWNLGNGPRQKGCTAEWVLPFWYERIERSTRRLPVFNIAAGACQSYFGNAREIVDDGACAAFARDIYSFCALTTVRDKLAEDVHKLLGLAVTRMPCVSIHAWRRHQTEVEEGSDIALNFMPLAGHYNLDPQVDLKRWAQCFVALEGILRRRGVSTSLVAHDRKERAALLELFPRRNVFFSEDYRDYFRYYSRCIGGVFNRLHGALLLAGRGRPSVVIGNDSRAWMVDEVGLPRRHVSEADPDAIADALIESLNERTTRRLLETEEASFSRMRTLLGNSLKLVKGNAARGFKAKVVSASDITPQPSDYGHL